MYETPLYLMLIGLSLVLVFSGPSNGALPAVLQATGGLIAISSGGVLLRDVFSHSTNNG